MRQSRLIGGQLFPAKGGGALRAEIKFVPVLIYRIELGAGLYSGAVGGGVFVTVVDIIAPVVRPVVRGVRGGIVIAQIKFDNGTHLWELVERKNADDLHREEIPDFLFRLVQFIALRRTWQGTASQLLTEMNETEVTANVVTKLLARFSAEVLMPQGIEYRTKRTGTSRLIRLEINDSGDGNDGEISI